MCDSAGSKCMHFSSLTWKNGMLSESSTFLHLACPQTVVKYLLVPHEVDASDRHDNGFVTFFFKQGCFAFGRIWILEQSFKISSLGWLLLQPMEKFRLCTDRVWLTTLTLKIFSWLKLCAYLGCTGMFSWSVDSIPSHNLSLIRPVHPSFWSLCIEVHPLPTPTIIIPYYFFLVSLGFHICLEKEWSVVMKVSSSSS